MLQADISSNTSNFNTSDGQMSDARNQTIHNDLKFQVILNKNIGKRRCIIIKDHFIKLNNNWNNIYISSSGKINSLV